MLFVGLIHLATSSYGGDFLRMMSSVYPVPTPHPGWDACAWRSVWVRGWRRRRFALGLALQRFRWRYKSRFWVDGAFSGRCLFREL